MNVVQVIDCFVDGDTVCVVMVLATEGDLQIEINRKKNMN